MCDTAFTLLLWVKVLFLLNNAIFCENNANMSKINEVLDAKRYMFWN